MIRFISNTHFSLSLNLPTKPIRKKQTLDSKYSLNHSQFRPSHMVRYRREVRCDSLSLTSSLYRCTRIWRTISIFDHSFLVSISTEILVYFTNGNKSTHLNRVFLRSQSKYRKTTVSNSSRHFLVSASRLIQGYSWKIIWRNTLGSRSWNPSKSLWIPQ